MRNTYHGLYRDPEHLIPSWRSCSSYETLGQEVLLEVARPWGQALRIYCFTLLPSSPLRGLSWKVGSLFFTPAWFCSAYEEKIIEGVPFVRASNRENAANEIREMANNHKMALWRRRSPSSCGLGEDAVFQHPGQKLTSPSKMKKIF